MTFTAGCSQEPPAFFIDHLIMSCAIAATGSDYKREQNGPRESVSTADPRNHSCPRRVL